MSVDYDWLGAFARGEDTPSDDPLLRHRLGAYKLRQEDLKIQEAAARRDEAEHRRELYEAQHRLRIGQHEAKFSPEARAMAERQQRYREEALAWRKQNAAFNNQWRQDHQMRVRSARRWQFFGGSTHHVARWFADTHRRMATVPTPGGLAGIVGAIVLLLLFIVPVNSSKETRGNLVSDVLRGAKQVDAGTPPQALGEVAYTPEVATTPTSTGNATLPVFTPGINMPLLPGVIQ